jgi:uncharacterized membrane protein YkvA (DUF1232 family)
MKKAEIDEILSSDDAHKNTENEQTIRDKFWLKFRETANRIPFSEDVAAAYYCALDPQTPNKVRGILLAALAYFIMPLDTIPDFLVGFGLTDDLTVLTVAFTAISGNITDAHRAAAKKALEADTAAQ